MRRSKTGIIAKIAVLVGLVEFIAFSTLGFVYAERYSSKLEKDIQERIHLINKMLANEEMPISNITRISFMSSMIGEPYLEGMVIGNNGFIIVSSKPEYLGRKADSVPDLKKQWLGKEEGERFISSENTLTSVAHLKSEIYPTPLYHTVIKIDTQNLSLTKSRVIWFGIIGSLLFILLSTAAIIFFAQRFLAKRINDSLDILQLAEKGDLDVQIPVSQLDELGKLQKGINSMIKKVGELLFEYKQSVEEVKEAQKKTLEQKEEFESIFNYSQDSIAIIDLESNFLNCNSACIGFTGYSKDELLKLNYDNITISRDKQSNLQEIQTVIKRGFIQNIEKEYVIKSGKHVNALISMSLLPDKERILLSIKDITATKMLESQSRLASMGEMIGNIAHQWRQPLSTITTAASGMDFESEMGTLTKEKINYYADGIEKNAQYLSDTIDTFRDYIKENKELKSVIVQERIATVLQIMDASLKNHNIKIETHIEPDPVKVKMVAQELDQVIINVLNNAKDILTEKDIQNAWIKLELLKQESKVIIRIEDNGGGIPEDVMPHIFEPYFTTKHQSQGTGLGLHMSYKIVTESLHGKLYARNSVNGARFFIEFPLKSDTKE
jgi:PAS domain S-box-containing protein